MKSSYHGVVNFVITGSRRNGSEFRCDQELQSNQCDEKGANLLQNTLCSKEAFFRRGCLGQSPKILICSAGPAQSLLPTSTLPIMAPFKMT